MCSRRTNNVPEYDARGHKVAPGVFDNAIDPRWTAEFLSDPQHHFAVAIDEGRVVGTASAVHYVHKAPGSGSTRSGWPRRTRDRGSAAG